MLTAPTNLPMLSGASTWALRRTHAEQLSLLSRCFDRCFKELNTQVLPSENFHGAEPIYLPACDTHPARIGYAHGFPRSLLHEVAHWCVAGAQRRQLVDYGYWYAEDGRTLEQQLAFEVSEVKPQAIEWFSSQILGINFEASLDNLSLLTQPDALVIYDGGAQFKQALTTQLRCYQSGECKLPPRAQRWIDSLKQLALE